MAHSDKYDFSTSPDMKIPGHRMRGAGPSKQTDGRRPLPHVITGLLTLILSLVVGHYSHILQGQQGPAGTTTVISKPVTSVNGLCVYVGSGSSISQRVQITSPKIDASGPWCPKGHFVSVAVPTGGTGKK